MRGDLDILQWADGKISLYPEQKFLLKLMYGLPLSEEPVLQFRLPNGRSLDAISELEYLDLLSSHERYKSCEHSLPFLLVHKGSIGVSALQILIAAYELCSGRSKQVWCVCPNPSELIELSVFYERIVERLVLRRHKKPYFVFYENFLQCSFREFCNYEESDLVLADELLHQPISSINEISRMRSVSFSHPNSGDEGIPLLCKSLLPQDRNSHVF